MIINSEKLKKKERKKKWFSTLVLQRAVSANLMYRTNKSPLNLRQGSPITISWWRWIGAFLPMKLLPLVWCPQHRGDKCLCSLIIKHKQIVWGVIGLPSLSFLHFSSHICADTHTHTRTQLHAQNKRTTKMKKLLPTTGVEYQISC